MIPASPFLVGGVEKGFMMPEQSCGNADFLSPLFVEHRERLLALATRKLNPVLQARLSVEDLVQDAFVAACKRVEYFENHPEVPVYFKLRAILLQAIADSERKHLQCQKRDAYKEVDVSFRNGDADSRSAAQDGWDAFADSVTSPLSRMARAERHALLRQTLEALPENDRRILELRHFDGLSNQECARVLDIEPKAASIRYARALERLQTQLAAFTEFRP